MYLGKEACAITPIYPKQMDIFTFYPAGKSCVINVPNIT